MCRFLIVIGMAAKAEYQQAQKEKDHHTHSDPQGDQCVIKRTLRQGTIQCQVGRGAEYVADSGQYADDEKGPYREHGSSQMAKDGVRDIENDDDHQDPVDRSDDGLREFLSVPQKTDSGVHQHNAGHQQEAPHDCVLNTDNDPPHELVRSERVSRRVARRVSHVETIVPKSRGLSLDTFSMRSLMTATMMCPGREVWSRAWAKIAIF